MLGPLMNTSHLRRPSTRRSGRGLGLVELMVAMVIGLVVVLVAHTKLMEQLVVLVVVLVELADLLHVHSLVVVHYMDRVT